jgi:hypothetical protein
MNLMYLMDDQKENLTKLTYEYEDIKNNLDNVMKNHEIKIINLEMEQDDKIITLNNNLVELNDENKLIKNILNYAIKNHEDGIIDLEKE